MTMNREPLETLYRICKAVAAGVKIGIVNLVRISGQHHLSPFARPGDDRLYLMRGKVLGLVNNHILLGNGAAANIGQGLHLNDITLEKFFHLLADCLILLILFFVAPSTHKIGKVVKNRLHPVRELLFLVSRQVAEILAKRNDRPGDKDPFIAFIAQGRLEPGSKSKQGLARACLADQGDDFNRGLKEQFKGHALLPAPGPELPGLIKI